MNRKRLADRRARSLELGKRDAALRCAYGGCRRALKAGAVVDFLNGRGFCSTDCLDAQTERETLEAQWNTR